MLVVEVIATDEFLRWFEDLSRLDKEAVERTVKLLEMAGVTLGFPYSSAIKGSQNALRELRVKSSSHALRIIYAFDPRRDAVLIIGGDKTGDGRFYEKLLPWAERIWRKYLAEQKAGEHDEED